jgi:Fic family protein
MTGFIFKIMFFLLFIFVSHMLIQYIQTNFRTPKPKLSRSLNNEKYTKMMEQIQNSSDDKLFDKEHIEKLNDDLQRFMDEQISQTIS